MSLELPTGFKDEFKKAHNRTLMALTEVCSATEEVICGPLDGTGMSGWNFEYTNPNHSTAMQGDLEYGIAYLTNMINQGFNVGFAAWNEKDSTLVCLKTWEPGEEEPGWPRSTESAAVYYHESPKL